MQRAVLATNEPRKLIVRYGTPYTDSRQAQFSFFLARGEERIKSLARNGMGEVTGARIMEMPKCFLFRESVKGDFSLGQTERKGYEFEEYVGCIIYSFNGKIAISSDYRPKAHASEVPRLGYYLEAIAINILMRKYGSTNIANSVFVSGERIGQLIHVGLLDESVPAINTSEVDWNVGMREWLIGLGKGIREAVEMHKKGFRA